MRVSLLRYPEAVARHAAAVVRERERVLTRLRAVPGVTLYPSRANFFLMRTVRPGDEVFQALWAQGVLVRNFSHAPFLADCLRVTIGTQEENDLFLEALTRALGQGA